ncbi:MAG: hypothetical protein V3S79_01100 [Candidatus Thermoplasmatota archaeon]
MKSSLPIKPSLSNAIYLSVLSDVFIFGFCSFGLISGLGVWGCGCIGLVGGVSGLVSSSDMPFRYSFFVSSSDG